MAALHVELLVHQTAAQVPAAPGEPMASTWCAHTCTDTLNVATNVDHAHNRYTREADAAAAAEEERRQNALKASKGILAASLGQQVKEQEALKHAHDDEEQVCHDASNYWSVPLVVVLRFQPRPLAAYCRMLLRGHLQRFLKCGNLTVVVGL